MGKIHADIRIYGIVQGVGFRPFVHKAVRELALTGTVKNTSYGAALSLEGEQAALDEFLEKINTRAPRLAFIERVETERSDELCGYTDFEIGESEKGEERRALISPDVGICDDCLRELFCTSDRRYRYPFINCTNCGPRFTITRDIPYDRKNTTMARFPMCRGCDAEYADIEDRRYHAQPNCCGECGPRLIFLDAAGKEVAGDPIEISKQYLRQGKIIAVKGLGGFHLACDSADAESVKALRERKRRDEKPFAIMCRDIGCAREYAVVSEDEERILSSHRRPIVLLEKRDKKTLLHISENGYVGIMLPYTPVHLLLLEGEVKSAVMTSANISDLPIIYKDEQAIAELSGIADGFLINDREIHARCDDSLLWVYRGHEYFARRSRGYVPYPISADRELGRILACGAEQKASFALSKERHIFPSQHIGDLKNLESFDNYREQIGHFENIFDIAPEAVVCDLHPDYMSTDYARERAERDDIPLYQVQHHHAHMASCMADNGYDGECIGIIWDGTGYGTDGGIWGAEFLLGDFGAFSRRGTIRPIRLPGGDRAAREISRIGASLLIDSGLPCQDTRTKDILSAGINCPSATGMGRLFDGAAAIIGIRDRVSYEGQSAVLLEASASDGICRVYPYSIDAADGIYVFDWRNMIRGIFEDKERGVPTGELAAVFMNTLVSFAGDMAEKISRDTQVRTVALSGGTFQNMYMLKRLDKRLAEAGFRVLTHRRLSPNDEGIAAGQIMIAQKIKERGNA